MEHRIISVVYLFQYKQAVPARIELASIVAKRADRKKPWKACPADPGGHILSTRLLKPG
jgi:hypothetical protein